MKSVKEKLKKGLVSQEEYRKQAMAATVRILEGANYQYTGLLGEGTFGSVVELLYAPLQVTYAAKIILEEYATAGEARHWPSLKHENILPLVVCQHFSTVFTGVFLMPKYPSTIDRRLETPVFQMDRQALQKSVAWLEGVLRGLQYLHRQGLYHLDVKCNNVLVDDDDSNAVLCDFGFLSCATEGTVKFYGTPFVFRPPEAHDGRSWSDLKSSLVPVEPTKFDVWTLGMMALEMFTRFSLSRAARKWHEPSWHNEIHATLYSILEVRDFRVLLRETFPGSDISPGQTTAIRNFIVICLRLDPRQRPTTDECLEQVLFDREQTFPDTKNCVSSASASPENEFLVGVFDGHACERSVAAEQSIEEQVVKEPEPPELVEAEPEPLEELLAALEPLEVVEAAPELPALKGQQLLSEGEIAPEALLHGLQVPKRPSRRKFVKGLFTSCFPMLLKRRSSN